MSTATARHPEAAPADAGEWINTAVAGRRLGMERGVVRRLIKQGRLTVRQLPGGRPRVLAADVERLARESVIPTR